VFLDIPNRPELRLRKAARSDAFALVKLVADNREHLKPQIWTHDLRTPLDVQPHVNHMVANMEAGNCLQYRILKGVEPAFPHMVGTVTLHSYSPEARQAYLGYWLTEDATGKGVASAASRRLLEYASEAWDLERINLNIAPGNVASERLATRLGASVTDEVNYERLPSGRTQEVRIWSMPA